jgi:hypothetical protein
MPKLPLNLQAGGVHLDCGDLPVACLADVSAEWAAELQDPQVAPIRDAIQAGQTAMLLEYQRRARYAAAQSDPLRATGEYLAEIGGYERGIYPQPNDTDASYRVRINASRGVVDPNDVIAAANAVLAPYTSISCRYAERSDGLFLNAGDATWSSHVFAQGDGGPNAIPNYPDRAYMGSVAAGLKSMPNRRPPGAMPNGDSYGRWFLLRCPDIGAIDSTVAAIFDGAQIVQDVGGFFVGSGTSARNASFLFDFASTVEDVYNAVIGAVDAIVGQSVRWTLIADPALTA